jgi:hypothetical protein
MLGWPPLAGYLLAFAAEAVIAMRAISWSNMQRPRLMGVLEWRSIPGRRGNIAAVDVG